MSSSSSSSSSTPIFYSLTLEQEISPYDVAGRTQAYRLRVTVIDEQGFNDPNIFLYLTMPPDAAGNDRAVFQAMCSPLDLETYPVGQATSSSGGFFRLAQIDLIHTSRNILDETWRLIILDRNELIRTMTKISTLEVVEISEYDSSMVGNWKDPGTTPAPVGRFGVFSIDGTNTYTTIYINGMTPTGALRISPLPSTGPAPGPGTPIFTQQPGINHVYISVPVAPGTGYTFNGTWAVDHLK